MKSFKFKLFRKCEYWNDKKKVKTIEYLSDIKIAGINRKQVVTRYHDFKLPKYEKDGKTPLASSVETSKFTVQYYLRCFVKH